MQKIFLASALVLGFAATAVADEATSEYDYSDYDYVDLFMELDVEGNGVITREEAEAHPELLEQFDDLDQEGTGFLTIQELQEFEPSES